MILYNYQPKRLNTHIQPKRLNFLLFLLFFLFPNNIFAVTTTLTQSPSSISQDPFAITVSITGAKAGKNYLRVDLYKEGSTDYAGETYNGQEWYSGEDGTKYAPIDIASSETQLATISARLTSIPPNWSTSNSFFIRIRRYTASGSYTSSEAEASAIPISIIFPTPSPAGGTSPIPTPTTQSTPSPTGAPTPTPSPAGQSSLGGADNIFISEALTTPESGQHEWVELFNNNDHSITLNSWFIDDIENAGSSPQAFTLTINPKSYATIDMQSALFNNDGDSVRLLDNERIQKDYFSYSQAQQGKSISRNDLNSHEICIALPTKNDSNGSCIIGPTSTTNIVGAAQRELAGENESDVATVLGTDLESADDSSYPTDISVTAFQGIGHDSTFPRPTDYQHEPARTLNVPNNIFRHPSLESLIKTGATSAAGISLLNIIYILYRMKIWPPIHFRSKIFSSIGFPWSPG
ncbi:MAG: lamin tail domain-containing protein [Microgenomates group bacterium]